MMSAEEPKVPRQRLHFPRQARPFGISARARAILEAKTSRITNTLDAGARRGEVQADNGESRVTIPMQPEKHGSCQGAASTTSSCSQVNPFDPPASPWNAIEPGRKEAFYTWLNTTLSSRFRAIRDDLWLGEISNRGHDATSRPTG